MWSHTVPLSGEGEAGDTGGAIGNFDGASKMGYGPKRYLFLFKATVPPFGT